MSISWGAGYFKPYIKKSPPQFMVLDNGSHRMTIAKSEHPLPPLWHVVLGPQIEFFESWQESINFVDRVNRDRKERFPGKKYPVY